MKQYTTPLETLILDIDISTGYDVWVYMRQGGTTLEKTGADIDISPVENGCSKIEFSLTQEETAGLASGVIQVEVTWKNRATGYVGKSETANIVGVAALKKEVV